MADPKSPPGADFHKHPVHEIRPEVPLPGHDFVPHHKDIAGHDKGPVHHVTRDHDLSPEHHATRDAGVPHPSPPLTPGPTPVHPAGTPVTAADFRIEPHGRTAPDADVHGGTDLSTYGISPEGLVGVPSTPESDPAPVLAPTAQKLSPEGPGGGATHLAPGVDFGEPHHDSAGPEAEGGFDVVVDVAPPPGL
ncbi:hypothetical protein GCM10010174_68820 [Kutzneria viridogrisea]|uniref:Uncharacterized protein n=2 Tax=Kutzneria TaxID=43356 RepID=W5WEG2_9PSEU|nr:hypothetical protein [Kutzneria albida]AHH99120.1 hypothetical protein KALB_5759 [Kutzneria albida DSM 43870]MBA8923325.1 hypothetical protein [Kutzneria viridogrisea]